MLLRILILTDIKPQFKVIEQVIDSIDRPMPQVVIEVEMLDVSKRAIDELGVNWPQSVMNLDVTGKRLTRFPFGGAAQPTGNIQWAELISPGGVDFSSANIPTNQYPPSAFTLIGEQLTLDMLRTNSDTKSLARPKILTLSNESAEVNLTIDEVIGVTNTYDTDGNISSSEAERAQTGTRLRVTPQVNPETKEVTLVLDVFNREAKDSGITVSGNETKNVAAKSSCALEMAKRCDGGLVKRSTRTCCAVLTSAFDRRCFSP